MKCCYTVVPQLELVRLCGVSLSGVLQRNDNEEEIIKFMFSVTSCRLTRFVLFYGCVYFYFPFYVFFIGIRHRVISPDLRGTADGK